MLRLRRTLLVAVALFAATVGVVTYATHVLRRLELTTVDTRFSVRGHHRPPPQIVLVNIDDVTFAALPVNWPFCRATHGTVIDNIARDRPAAIIYDVQLTDPPPRGCGGTNDSIALLGALQDANGRAVMATTETDSKGHTRFVGQATGTEILQGVGAQAANALLPQDPGGVDRRFNYEVGGLPTMAVVGTEVATRHKVSPQAFGGPSMPAWIDFYGPTGTFPSQSFSKVYQGHLPRGYFHNKIVVVGASTPTLHDVAATPTSSLMPGDEVQANAIATVLEGLPLKPAPGWLDVVLILVLATAVPLASLRLGPIAFLTLAVALGAAFTVATQLAFNGGLILAFVYAIAALALATLGSLSVHLVTGAFERERVRDLFSRFVPENVVDEVLARADEGLRLGGVQREATVMFTDLRGFTSFAESLSPDQVIDVLNHYLSEMSDSILDHGGTLVAYMGDGIMAVFGAPIEEPDHADRALATAREMISVRLPRFNSWLKEQKLSSGFRMGIGLNTGSVMSGNVGSERRVEYTAVGDATNTASRIEAMTKGTAHQLFLSTATKEALLQPPEDLEFVDDFDVRGRVARLGIWSLVEDGAAAARVAAERAKQGDQTPAAADAEATAEVAQTETA